MIPAVFSAYLNGTRHASLSYQPMTDYNHNLCKIRFKLLSENLFCSALSSISHNNISITRFEAKRLVRIAISEQWMLISVVLWCEYVARWQFTDLPVIIAITGPVTFLLFYRGRSRGDKAAINNLGKTQAVRVPLPFHLLYTYA